MVIALALAIAMTMVTAKQLYKTLELITHKTLKPIS
jgi:hypothetical protein